ncbi:DUF502 domain-containing protein [Caldalkalibacillus salinus]|uniref:DUF502 domain-containing protein n=1 Tax=Caldalkalibacillus salinus TaxID=2803787 RepID=UPI001922AB1A|nr:DUF502 domain-containing protein [Caldalkalibacillus salinus]
MIKQIRHYLVMGLIALLPALVTIYVLQIAFRSVDRILGNAVTQIMYWLGLTTKTNTNEFVVLGWSFEERIPGIGFVLMIVILIGVGYVTKGLTGKRIIQLTEHTFKKIPIARSVYSTVQQVITALIQDRSSFKKVVLVEYPRPGIYTIGFLTGESKGEVQIKTSQECYNVFLPTTPNPTSGWLVLVPKEDVTFLDMTVEQGLKYIISGGVVVPRSQKYPILKTSHDVEQDTERILKQMQENTDLDVQLRMNIKSKDDM